MGTLKVKKLPWKEQEAMNSLRILQGWRMCPGCNGRGQSRYTIPSEINGRTYHFPRRCSYCMGMGWFAPEDHDLYDYAAERSKANYHNKGTK